VRSGRIAEDFEWSGNFEGAPDLAVEVASPGQSIPYFLRHVERYLQAGVEEVWIIYPPCKEIHQYRAGDDAPVVIQKPILSQHQCLPILNRTLQLCSKKKPRTAKVIFEVCHSATHFPIITPLSRKLYLV
jgi:Uma2 family endonuclease